MPAILRPDVFIEQKFVTTSPTVIEPVLEAALVGPCFQLIDFQDSLGNIISESYAGTYEGDQASYAYPSLISGAVPVTSTVRVFLRFGLSTTQFTELDSDEFTATTGAITIDAAAGGIVDTKVSVYIQYEALRTDITVTPAVTGVSPAPCGVEIETLDDISTYLGEVDTRNPLGLAAWCAKQTGQTTAIRCVGVDAVDANQEGTSASYARAFEGLEGCEVYGIAPLTQNPTIHGLLRQHVLSMSSVNMKKERIALISSEFPTHGPDITIASGSYGNTIDDGDADDLTDVFTVDVDLNIAEVAADDILEISGVAGTFIILTNTQFTVTVSVDGIPDDLVDAAWSITREGVEIASKGDAVDAIAAIATGYAHRRIYHIWPDLCEIEVAGITQRLPSYYLCAAIAGLIGELAYAQPLTNYPIAGISGVINSNDYFTPSQLNKIAGGGNFICYQPTASTLPVTRHQLSTDVSSIEKRELSITKSIDAYVKSLRYALAPYTGRNIITQKFLDYVIAPTTTGVNRHFEDKSQLEFARIVNLMQNETEPDHVTLDIEVKVLYPANYINITIEV